MNVKIFVGIAIVAFAVILGTVTFFGQSIFYDASTDSLLKPLEQKPVEILPLQIELADITIIEVTKRAATIDIKFNVTNPNFKSTILQFIKYELYEDGQRIHAGQIGKRPNLFVTESNYFTILSERSTILSDQITIKNTGNTPKLWNVLANNSPSWTIIGEAYFNLSSITSGGENIITFEFTS